MLTRWQRRAYYGAMGPFMWASGCYYRYCRAPTNGLKVQLGPGKKCYLHGWLNVDSNAFTAKIDLWANLANRLPFRPGSVSALYSFSVLQHLPFSRIEPLLKEMYRCMAPGGYVRLGAIHAGNAAKAYVENRADWFGVYPIEHRSLGGRFENFLLCAGDIFRFFDFGYMRELLAGAGFTEVMESAPGRTAFPGIFGEAVKMEEETSPDLPHHVVVEMRKS